MGALAFIVIALAFFGALNLVAIRALLLLHPRGRRLTIFAALFSNVMWLCLPFVDARNAFSRFTRAFFGPPWFGWLVFLLLYCALLLVLVLVWLPFKSRTTFTRFAHAPSLIFLTLVAAAAVAGYYDATVPLRVERVPVTISGLAPELEGRRIALLADLHVGLFTRQSRVEQFFRTASALRPDALAIDGDLIDDDPVFVPKLLRATRVIDARIPVIAVLGNHEMYGAPFTVIGALRGSRIRLLVNEGIAIRGLWFAGVADYAALRSSGERAALAPDLARALGGRPASAPVIVLSHQPKVFDEAVRRRLPLSLVAHTHGGQCGIRSLRWSVAGLFLKYHMGLYRVGVSQLYVNTGTGYWLLPFRLGMTPEITLIELHAVRPAVLAGR